MPSRLAFAVLLLGAATTLAAADIYKWVDEKGVTHFSESPPPDGKATKLDVKPTPPSSPVPAAGAQDWKQRELELRQRRIEKARNEEKAEQRAQQDAAERKSRCMRAQRELDVLRRLAPVYSMNERGERVYVEDKDRPAQIARWEKLAAAYCDSK